MVTVKFFTLLRLLLKMGEIELPCEEETTIREILAEAERVVEKMGSRKFLRKLLDEEGTIKKGTIILVNGRNVLDGKGLDTPVNNGDEVALFPPGGGG